MNEKKATNINEILKEAKIKRIYAEIGKIEEEKLKVALERKELERNLNLPWSKFRSLFQAIIAGLIAIPLIWFYVKEIAIPIYNKENIQLAWKNEVTKDSLNRAFSEFKKQELIHQEKVIKLNAEKDSINRVRLNELNRLRNEYFRIDSIRANLFESYMIQKEASETSQRKLAVKDSIINNLNQQIAVAMQAVDKKSEFNQTKTLLLEMKSSELKPSNIIPLDTNFVILEVKSTIPNLNFDSNMIIHKVTQIGNGVWDIYLNPGSQLITFSAEGFVDLTLGIYISKYERSKEIRISPKN